MTEYIVLVHGSGSVDWMEVGRETTASADAAIRAASSDTAVVGTADGDIYVAVPARSWNPRAVTVKTETRILIGETR